MDSSGLYSPPVSSPDKYKGIAVAILILGIISDVMCVLCIWGYFFSLICSIIAVVLYLAFKSEIGSNAIKLAKAGFICGIVSLSLTVLVSIATFLFYFFYMVLVFGMSLLSVFDSIF